MAIATCLLEMQSGKQKEKSRSRRKITNPITCSAGLIRAGKAESGWTCKLKSPINMHTHTLLLLTATYTWTLIR